MDFSIIICTHNRAEALPSCLASILAALKEGMPIEAEIIVVDNASTDKTRSVLDDLAQRSPFPFHVVSEPRKGLSIARNSGVAASNGEILVFTDDDCHPAPNYFQVLKDYKAQDTEWVLRGGKIQLGDPADQPLTILTRNETLSWKRNYCPANKGTLIDALMGANMVMPRSLFNQIGPFDIRLGAGSEFKGAEDTDYVFRVYTAGYLIQYVPNLVVDHFHGRKTIEEAKKLFFGYMISKGALFAKHTLNDVGLLRPLYWDIKAYFREMFSRGYYYPALQIPNRGIIIRVILFNMLKFWWLSAKTCIRSNKVTY